VPPEALWQGQERLASDTFWREHERLVHGTRARVLHLSAPLRGLGTLTLLRLSRQSFVLTVQSTTQAVWRCLDRLGDVKGFAPPVLAPSQVLSLWLPAALARASRLLLVLLLWYGGPVAGLGEGYARYAEQDVVGWLWRAAQNVMQQQVDELHETTSSAMGNVVNNNQAPPPFLVPSEASHSLSIWRQARRTQAAETMESLKEGPLADAGAWPARLPELYCHSLVANICVCLVVAIYWRAVGLFSIGDALRQAVAIFIDTDSQFRKIILLRYAPLSSIVKIIWLLLSITTQCLLPLRTILESRYWLNPCVLLDVLLQQGLVPGPAQLLAVSGADMKDSLMYNSMLLDSGIVQSLSLTVSSAMCMLGNPKVQLTDVTLFVLQFILKTLKAPLDAHTMRLMRMKAVAGAIQRQRDDMPMAVWRLEPGECVRRFAGSERVKGVVMEAASWATLPQELLPQDSVRDDIGWSLSFVEVPVRTGWATVERRLAVSLAVPEDDVWALWTVQVEGSHRWFRRRPKSPPSPTGQAGKNGGASPVQTVPSLDGQWARWHHVERRARDREVLRIEDSQLHWPGIAAHSVLEASPGGWFRVRGPEDRPEGDLTLEANDWGMLRMSDGSRWVRTGPQALLEGTMYEGIRVVACMDSFSESSGALTFQREGRTLRKALSGAWRSNYEVFELQSKARVRMWKEEFAVQELKFHAGGCTLIVVYEQSTTPVSWPLRHVAERVESRFSQTFSGESVGGEGWRLPRVMYGSWWAAVLRCRPWLPTPEGHACLADSRDHPRFSCHKGPGRLVAHSDPEARDAAASSDGWGGSCFLGNDRVQVDRVTLVLHACARKFREPRCAEALDPCGRHAAAAAAAGYADGLAGLSSPLELHVQLWPEVDRSVELCDDVASGYVHLASTAGPLESNASGRGNLPKPVSTL